MASSSASSTRATDNSPAVAPPRQPTPTASAKKSKNKAKNGTSTSKALLASEFTSDSTSPAILTSATAAPRAKPAILPIAPNSSLLSRLDAFLPQLQQANTSLFAAMAKEDGDEERKRKFDIESVTPGQDKVIEMKLGLGLFEARDPSSSSHADTLSLPTSGPMSGSPAISFVTPAAAATTRIRAGGASDGPRIYSAADMDVDSSSSDDDDDDDDSDGDEDDSRSGEEEAITAESLEEMVMRFYSEPLGEGDESDDGDEDQEGGDRSDGEADERSGAKTPLVEEMMEGVEATTPSPKRS